MSQKTKDILDDFDITKSYQKDCNPCPICKAEQAVGTEFRIGPLRVYGLECWHCWTDTEFFPVEQEAVDAWNRGEVFEYKEGDWDE